MTFIPPAPRFDLLHVMLDELTEEEDGRIAAHIVALHKDPAATISRAPFTMEQLQRYIKYARAIKPRLTPAVRMYSSEQLTHGHTPPNVVCLSCLLLGVYGGPPAGCIS